MPAAGIGGELTAGGWRRGVQSFGFSGNDGGAGVRFGETTIDGGRVDLTEYLCQKVQISGEWRGTRMQPCLTLVGGSATIDTTRFSDGPHTLGHCATDFAGNVGCAAPSTVLIDNNPPARPQSAALGGRRRVAPRRRLRPRLVESRPGPGEPDLGRLLADHRARPASTPG